MVVWLVLSGSSYCVAIHSLSPPRVRSRAHPLTTALNIDAVVGTLALDSFFLKDRDASRVRTLNEMQETLVNIEAAYERRFAASTRGTDVVEETWWRVSTAIVRVCVD